MADMRDIMEFLTYFIKGRQLGQQTRGQRDIQQYFQKAMKGGEHEPGFSLGPSGASMTLKKPSAIEQIYRSYLETGGGLPGLFGGAGELPEGYEEVEEPIKRGGAIIGYQKVRRPKKLTGSEAFRNKLNQAKRGEITWDKLKDEYPEPSKQKTIEEVRRSTLPKLERSPKFRMGRGLPALISKDIAKINKETLKVIKQIENEEDLEELLERRDEAKIAGIDVDAILEYFGRR